MEQSTVTLTMIGLYLALTLWVGLRAGRGMSSTVDGFVAGDRDFGFLVMYFVTGATVFSAFAFLGGPGWAYSRGAAAFYILSYGALGMLPWYVIGPKVARIGRRFGQVTQAQFLTGRFPSRGLSVLIALLSIVALIPYITLQMRGAGIVMEAVTEGRVPLWAGAAIGYGVVLMYVLVSGVSAVGWTNTLQGVFMIAIAWSLGLYLPNALYGGIGPMFEDIQSARPELLELPGLAANGEPWLWGSYSSAILISAIGINMWPQLFMKAFTARDERILRRTVVWFPSFQLMLVPVFLIGFAGVLYIDTPVDADFVLPYLVLNVDLPMVVVGLFCAGALSASMSTGDALLHAAASVAVEDGIRPFATLDQAQQRFLIRIFLLLAGVIAYFFAVSESTSLVVLLLSSYGIIAQLAPPVVAALFWRRATTPGVVVGLLVGSATTLVLFIAPGWKPLELHAGLLGLIAHVPTLVAVSLLTPAQERKRVEAYVNPVAVGASGQGPSDQEFADHELAEEGS